MTDNWNQLLQDCCACKACELHKSRTNCVFGTGNVNADILFGEKPRARTRTKRERPSWAGRDSCWTNFCSP